MTLSAHLVSDGSGSHCPRKVNIFTVHIVANMSVELFISTTVDMPYPNVLTYMLSILSPLVPATSFNMEMVTLNYWEFAVFDDAL